MLSKEFLVISSVSTDIFYSIYNIKVNNRILTISWREFIFLCDIDRFRFGMWKYSEKGWHVFIRKFNLIACPKANYLLKFKIPSRSTYKTNDVLLFVLFFQVEYTTLINRQFKEYFLLFFFNATIQIIMTESFHGTYSSMISKVHITMNFSGSFVQPIKLYPKKIIIACSRLFL